MDENAASGAPGEVVGGTVPHGRPPGKYPRGARLAIGSIVSFVVASLLYGPSTVMTLLFFATVCTLGVGLLFILAGCYLVGWVVLEVWSSVARSGSAPSTS